MTTYLVGGTVGASATFTAGGLLTDPTELTAQVSSPDGAVAQYTYQQSPDIVRDGPGAYHLNFQVPEVGVYTVRWVGTGSAAGAFEESFTVDPSRLGKQPVVTPDEVGRYTAKALLQSDVDFLNALVELMTSELETFLNRPLSVSTYNETYTSYDMGIIYLRNTPVVSVASVTVSAPGANTMLDPTTYTVFPYGIELADPQYNITPYQTAWGLFSSNEFEMYNVEALQLAVAYTGGLNGRAIPAIRNAMLHAVTREWLAQQSDVQNVTRAMAGRANWFFADQNVGGFTDRELTRLERWRRRVVVA